MAHSDLQHGFPCSVVDGQGHIEPGDGQIPHNPGAGYIQCRGIVGKRIRTIQRFRVRCQEGIVFFRLLEPGGIILFLHPLDAVFIVHHGPGLVGPVHRVTDRGVEHHGKAHQKDQNQQECTKVFFHNDFPLREAIRRSSPSAFWQSAAPPRQPSAARRPHRKGWCPYRRWRAGLYRPYFRH